MNFVRTTCVVATLLVGTAAWAATPAPAPKEKAKSPPAAATPDVPLQIDLNTVDLKTLAAMPEIGPELAQAIVAARPFDSIDDLARVRGMSAERLEQIRARVRVVRAGQVVAETLAGRASDSTEPLPPTGRGKVDVNTADAKTLAKIPSIGPELASAIVAARPFTSLDELSHVQGMSAERLEHIRTEVTLSPVPPKAKRNKGR